MGIFSRFFKKSSRLEKPADLSLVRCDLHSHFIPGIDDGAPDMEASMNLLREMASLGYKKVITTPHVMSDTYRNTVEGITSGLQQVRTAIKSNNINIEIEAAAEYYLDYEFEKKIENKEILSFGKAGVRYVLFELPFIFAPDSMNSIIFNLQSAGYKPVLAHPERYTYWHRNFKKYEELIEKGVLFQLNINSITGHYSPEVKQIAEQMIELGMISFLGSDCHHPGHIELIRSKALYEEGIHNLISSGRLLNAEL